MKPLTALYRFIQNRIPAPADLYTTPVIINSFNRLSCLQLQIARLQKAGMKNIHILDNASSYPPLLDYYNMLPAGVTLHRLKKNLGYKALWKSWIYNRFRWGYYIYTDPDVIPTENCPNDFIEFFYNALKTYPDIGKVGFGLKIDDLPDHYNPKQQILEWETHHHYDPKKRRGAFYTASIDTTFALYRPLSSRRKSHWKLPALRSAEPYIARHLGWYLNTDNPSEEDIFYKNLAVIR
jgi:hypothetical protein